MSIKISVKVTRKSGLTGNTSSITILATEAEIAAYKAGALIQVAFPDLTADEREFVMTGITPAEWATAFPEE